MIIVAVLFWINAFLIVWAMGGYRVCLKLLGRLFSSRRLKKDYGYKPTVTIMIVAHNEEKVIEEKLFNVIHNDYPEDKIDYIVTSDFSTDRTDAIVEQFINDHPNLRFRLHKAVEHKGKTNAQNEAQKLVTGEILVMTDANAMFEENAISELVACFCEENIAYVTGRLSYVNTGNSVADSEAVYWEGDLAQRMVESNISTITAGNGAIYACRNSEYVDFAPIECHDSSMPKYYAMHGMRAVYNPDAVAKEKAGEVIGDEFKRKVRMNRAILADIKEAFPCLNLFKLGWFSFFYFGHRMCRKLLWIAHAMVFLGAFVLTFHSLFYGILFGGQIFFYLLALLALMTHCQNRLLKMAAYYTMTIAAQWVAVYRALTGRSKAVWDKAESTR